MSATEIGFAGIAALLVLLALRVPVALALILVSFVGIGWIFDWQPAFGLLASTPYDFVTSWTLSSIPMFLLMGFVSFHTGITSGLFDAAKTAFRRVPGNLAISGVIACSGFAAVCGSSLACAAAMGRIAIPEMVRSGYQPNFASGTIAAGGTIGALIPPSILMIVYGVFSETSIIKVFLGGISVGLFTAASYIAVILILSRLRPDIVPPAASAGAHQSVRQAVAAIWPVLALSVAVFGGLFSGIFTATEAGAIGAVGAILISLTMGRLTWQVLRQSLLETLSTCASLFIIGVGAAMFTRFLGVSGLAGFISSAVTGSELSYVQLMIIVVLVYLLLGMFMEPFGAMLVTLPIFLPIFDATSINLVWFGVLLTKLLEIGMISPPFGMNVFIIRGVAAEYVTLTGIFRGISLFLLADLVVVTLIIAFQDIVLFLPGLLG
jgi:tripartite ATP-independent transporter DctM subunit